MWISRLNSNILLTNTAIGPPSKRLHCVLVGLHSTHFVVVQPLSCVQFFATPWTATHQASLSFTISRSLLRFMSIESVMPSNISSSAIPFSSCLHPFSASGSFLMTRVFVSDAQSSGASALASVLPKNIQDWFPFGWIIWSPCSLRDSQESSLVICKCSEFLLYVVWGEAHLKKSPPIILLCSQNGALLVNHSVLWLGEKTWPLLVLVSFSSFSSVILSLTHLQALTIQALSEPQQGSIL